MLLRGCNFLKSNTLHDKQLGLWIEQTLNGPCLFKMFALAVSTFSKRIEAFATFSLSVI